MKHAVEFIVKNNSTLLRLVVITFLLASAGIAVFSIHPKNILQVAAQSTCSTSTSSPACAGKTPNTQGNCSTGYQCKIVDTTTNKCTCIQVSSCPPGSSLEGSYCAPSSNQGECKEPLWRSTHDPNCPSSVRCCAVNSTASPTPGGPTPTPGDGGGGGIPSGECNATCYNDGDCTGGLVCHGEGPTNAGNCRNANCTTSTSCLCAGNGCNTPCDLDSQCPSGKICYTNLCRNPWCKSDADCQCNNPICAIKISVDKNPIAVGETTTMRATVLDESNGGIDWVTFIATNSAVAKFTNGTILANGSSRIQVTTRVANQYTALISGVGPGSTKVTATASVVTDYGTQTCSSQLLLNVFVPTPYCKQIYFYKVTNDDVNDPLAWQQITLNDITQGDVIYMALEGDLNGSTETFDMARFFISIEADPLVTNQFKPGTNLFYARYQVPLVAEEIFVIGQLHGTTSGAWY